MAISARAIATRCNWPPDSSCGKRPCTSASDRPTWRSAASAAACARRRRLRAGEVARGHEQVAVEALQRVEGLERVLEDRLHLAHEVQPLRAGRAGSAMSTPLKRMLPALGAHGAQDHARQRGLAAARLADDGQDLGPLGAELEAHVVDRARAAAEQPALGVAAHHVLKLQQRLRSCCRRRVNRKTGHAMARRHRRHHRHLLLADLHRQRAARVEAAAARRVGQVRRRALQRRARPSCGRCAAGWRSGARCRGGAGG